MAKHVLLLSFPMQGHIMPLLQLGHRLASNYGVLVSFVISHSLASSTSNFDGRRLRMVSVPDGLPSTDSPHQADFAVQEQAMQGMRNPVEQLLRSSLTAMPTSEGLPSISLIISDIFVTWSFDVATSLSLPLVAFYTANATSCSVLYHTRPLLNQGVLPLHTSDGNAQACNQPLNCIPGVPPLTLEDLPPSMQQPDETDHRFQFTLQLFEHIHDCEYLLLNTVYELEARAIDALQQKIPIYTVGPLLLPTSEEEKSPAEPDVSFWKEEKECLAWVDKHPPASVIYVSFGSIAKYSEEQLRELAFGLEASEQPFLWVIRKDAVHSNKTVEEALPKGFLERTQSQGLIVSWAPQLQLLSHVAVGGFLSHCGWNSILENISIAGVPMVCWPDKADQMVNRRMVVEEWGMGMEVEAGEGEGEGEGGVVVGRQEVERVVRQVLLSEEGQRMRLRASQLKEVVRKAVKEGGSSFCNLESFVLYSTQHSR